MLFRRALAAHAASLLVAANTDAGVRVHAARDWSLNASELPAILVYPHSERKEGTGNWTAPNFMITASVTVRAITLKLGYVDLDEAMDAIASQVEAALINPPGLIQPPPKECPYFPSDGWPAEAFDFVDSQLTMTADGDQHFGEVSSVFAVKFKKIYGPILGPPTAIKIAEMSATRGP